MVNWPRIKALAWNVWVIFRDGRQARPSSIVHNYAKTIVQSATMWLVFLAILPSIVLQIEAWLQLPHFSFPPVIAIVLFIFGATIAFFSQYFLVTRGDGTPLPIDSTRKFVVAGPYRYIRNPMAAGSLLQGYALALYFGSLLMLVYIFIGTMLWNYCARPWEERDLEAKFGEEFREYKREVRCWIPRLRPLQIKWPKGEKNY